MGCGRVATLAGRGYHVPLGRRSRPRLQLQKTTRHDRPRLGVGRRRGGEGHRVEGAGGLLQCYAARMKRVFVVLVAVALLAGCASKPTPKVTASPTTTGSSASSTAVANPQTKTYRNAAYGFSVTYDPSTFTASAAQPVTKSSYLLPGIGMVDGAFQPVTFRVNGSVSDSRLIVTACRPLHVVSTPTLARFTQEMRGDAGLPLVGSPQYTTLSGLPAIRYRLQLGQETVEGYAIYRGRCVYVAVLRAPTKLWPALAPKLNAVAQTFTVTP